MTIPIPEPVAKIGDTFQLLWAGARTISEIHQETGASVGDHLIITAQAEAYADARIQEALEAVGAGGVSGQRITQPSTDESQSAWFAGIEAGREIERHNSQLDNDAA